MKAKYLLVSLLLSAGLLIGCNGGNNNSSGNEELQYTQEEATAKTKQLAQEQGFEAKIHLEATDTGDEDSVNEDIQFGYTSEVFWMHGVGAYKKVEGGVEVYPYNEETHQYEGGYLAAGVDYDNTFASASVYLFTAYQYEEMGFTFNSKKSTTFLGRAATEYNAAYAGAEGAASITLVVDNETGMTLKVAAAGFDASGEGGSASFEVTILRIGNDVQIPDLIKNQLGLA